MKKIILLLTSTMFLISCGSSSADKAEAEYQRIKAENQIKSDSIDKVIAQLTNGTPVDSIDYTKNDCTYWIIDTIDQISGDNKVRSRHNLKIGETNNIMIKLHKDKKEIAVYFKVNGLGSCVDEEDKINILFDDNTRLELKNQAQYNCDANIVLWFSKSSKKIIELRDKKIKSMRATLGGKYFDVDLTENNSVQINKSIKCILDK